MLSSRTSNFDRDQHSGGISSYLRLPFKAASRGDLSIQLFVTTDRFKGVCPKLATPGCDEASRNIGQWITIAVSVVRTSNALYRYLEARCTRIGGIPRCVMRTQEGLPLSMHTHNALHRTCATALSQPHYGLILPFDLLPIMNGPRLNADTLLCILPFAGRATVSSLMQTCHFLHRAGAKYFLDDWNVISIATTQLDSFILFMLADELYRVPFLRILTLSDTIADEQEMRRTPFPGRALAQLFRHIAERGNLGALHFDLNVENFLCSAAELPLAIAELPKLKRLSMNQVGPRGRWLLKNLKSELVDAIIHLRHLKSLENDDPQNDRRVQTSQAEDRQFGRLGGDVVALCVHSCRSLRKLDMKSGSTIEHLRSVSTPQAIPVYTQLTDLRIGIDGYRGKLIGYLSRAFPNLAYLRTWQGLYADPSEYRESREINKQSQKELGRWTSLRCYRGTTAMLYALGIECHIPCMHLINRNDEFHATMLRAGLEDARPSHLELTFTGARWLLHDDFHAIFRGQGIKALKLEVVLDEHDLRVHPLRLLDAVVKKIVVPSRSLVTLKFSLDVECLTGEHVGPTFDQFKQIMGAVAVDKVARRMQQASTEASGSLANIWVELYVGDEDASTHTREACIGRPMDDPFWDDLECPAERWNPV
ncbi:hypothetical protein C8Q79DRAFT_17078 [Trametes meyenii]|nr:hypothetical protein C8Q79DRAFT_17078 [Trametes meyenii]